MVLVVVLICMSLITKDVEKIFHLDMVHFFKHILNFGGASEKCICIIFRDKLETR